MFYPNGKQSEPKFTTGLSMQVHSVHFHRSENFSCYSLDLVDLGIVWRFIVPDNHETMLDIILSLDSQQLKIISDEAEVHDGPVVLQMSTLQLESTINLNKPTTKNNETIELKSLENNEIIRVNSVYQTTSLNLSETLGDRIKEDKNGDIKIISIDTPFVTIIEDKTTQIPVLAGVVMDV